MTEEAELEFERGGSGITIRTPGQYCMGVAIALLEFLDGLEGVEPKNTGWREGFGLEVSAWIPIRTDGVVAELMTDGDETIIRHVSGPLEEYTWLLGRMEECLHTIARAERLP